MTAPNRCKLQPPTEFALWRITSSTIQHRRQPTNKHPAQLLIPKQYRTLNSSSLNSSKKHNALSLIFKCEVDFTNDDFGNDDCKDNGEKCDDTMKRNCELNLVTEQKVDCL